MEPSLIMIVSKTELEKLKAGTEKQLVRKGKPLLCLPFRVYLYDFTEELIAGEFLCEKITEEPSNRFAWNIQNLVLYKKGESPQNFYRAKYSRNSYLLSDSKFTKITKAVRWYYGYKK